MLAAPQGHALTRIKRLRLRDLGDAPFIWLHRWANPVYYDRIMHACLQGIDGAFADSHGREVMDLISPTNGKVIGRVTLGDEEDTRRAIAAAKRAFATFGRTTKDERATLLRRLHAA